MPTGLVTFELAKKHGKKIKMKILGTAAVQRRRGDADVQAQRGVEQDADDRLQRRSRLPGEQHDSAQADFAQVTKLREYFGVVSKRGLGPRCGNTLEREARDTSGDFYTGGDRASNISAGIIGGAGNLS